MTLAERMIVMNAGHMEQIGTPAEVYARPATTFVAGFIGSPPMNLVTGIADGTRLRIDGHELPLPAAAPRAGELIVGLRPEHAVLRAAGGPGWPFKIEMIEMLGAERLVHGRLGGGLFTVRVDATLTPPAVGDLLTLQGPAEQLHWFDPATQKRVA